MDKRELKKLNNVEIAKKGLNLVSNRMKEIKRKNKISKRKGNNVVLRSLFNKYHKGKFTLNKVRYVKHKQVLGDAGEYFKLMGERAWLIGFIVAKLNK